MFPFAKKISKTPSHIFVHYTSVWYISWWDGDVTQAAQKEPKTGFRNAPVEPYYRSPMTTTECNPPLPWLAGTVPIGLLRTQRARATTEMRCTGYLRYLRLTGGSGCDTTLSFVSILTRLLSKYKV